MIPNFSTNAVCTWPSPCGWFSHTLSTTFPHQPLPTHCLIHWSHNGMEISEGKFLVEIDTTPLSGSSKDNNNNSNTRSRFSHNFHFHSIPTQHHLTTARNTQHPTVIGGHCPTCHHGGDRISEKSCTGQHGANETAEESGYRCSTTTFDASSSSNNNI